MCFLLFDVIPGRNPPFARYCTVQLRYSTRTPVQILLVVSIWPTGANVLEYLHTSTGVQVQVPSNMNSSSNVGRNTSYLPLDCFHFLRKTCLGRAVDPEEKREGRIDDTRFVHKSTHVSNPSQRNPIIRAE